MLILYGWLLFNVFCGILYLIEIHRSDEWFDTLLFPLISRTIYQSGCRGIFYYIAYVFMVLFTLPYIIVHYVFLTLFVLIVLMIDGALKH